MQNRSFLRVLGLAALLCVTATAQATITVFITKSSFLAAVDSPGIDSFASPVDRAAGPHTYSASSTEASDANSDFFPVGTPADPWLTTFNPEDSISIYNFSNGVQGVGGLFFASDFDGAAMTGEAILIVATDASGSVQQTIVGTSASTFRGFLSTGLLTSMTISAVQGDNFAYPTINNLVLASPVPEPGNLVLLLAGIAAFGFISLRRQA